MDKQERLNQGFVIQSYSKAEFADFYHISASTLRRRFKAIGIIITHKHILWTALVEQYVKFYGPPKRFN